MIVDEYRVRMRVLARQPPFAPLMRGRVEHADLSRVPLAHPDTPFRIGPYPACALIRCRRIDDLRRAARGIDMAEIVACQGREVQAAVRRDADAVRAAPARRIEDTHSARRGFELAIDAVLPGKPEMTLLVEDRRIQVG